MSKTSFRITGDLTQVVFASLERTFTRAGARVRYPSDSEIEIRGDDYQANIYSMEESGDPDSYLLGGKVIGPVETTDDQVAKFAKLLEQAGAIYNIEYYVEDQPMRSLVHPAFLPAKDGDLVFELGSEYAPDAAFGLDRLTVREGGAFEYENRMRGFCSRSERGHLDGALVDQLHAALEESGFPTRPEQPSPPGSGYLIISRPAADEKVAVNVFAAAELPGYGSLVSMITQWTQALRAQPGTRELPDGVVLDPKPS